MPELDRKKSGSELGVGIRSVLNNPQHANESYIYHQGSLYRRDGEAKIALVNYTLPEIDWYDMVTIVSHPADEDELWLAMGPHGLFYSDDGGKTVEVLAGVAMAERVSSICVDGDFALILTGRLGDGSKGRFVSVDHGITWVKSSESSLCHDHDNASTRIASLDAWCFDIE